MIRRKLIKTDKKRQVYLFEKGRLKDKEMSEEILKAIDNKLTTIVKLLSVNAVKGKSEIEQMEFLDSMGMNSSEIGLMVGKSATNVRVQLSLNRKKKDKGKKVKKDG